MISCQHVVLLVHVFSYLLKCVAVCQYVQLFVKLLICLSMCSVLGFTNGFLRVLDVPTLQDETCRPLQYARDPITHIAFSHDSSFLATAVSSAVRGWTCTVLSTRCVCTVSSCRAFVTCHVCATSSFGSPLCALLTYSARPFAPWGAEVIDNNPPAHPILG